MRCQRIRIKTKGFNLGTIPENPKQNEGIEYGRDAGEPEKKERDQIRVQCQKTRIKKKRIASRHDAG